MRDVASKAVLHCGVYTPSELHRLARRLDRRITGLNTALAAMRGGQILHLQYQAGRPHWSLIGGRSVAVEVANLLISSTSVVPISGSLFDGVPGQTWRFAP